MKYYEDDKLISDIENVLKGYFGPNDMLDLKNTLQVQKYDEKNQPHDCEEVSTIGVNYSASALHRELINCVIPLAAKRISQTQFVKLLSELSELTINHGEFELAAEINEEIIIKVSGSDALSLSKAQAYLDLAKIAQRKAFWSESTDFVNKSVEIFKAKNNANGLARCENMLGTIFGEQGKILEAKLHFLNALNYLNDSEDLSFVAMLENNLGILESIQGNYANAKWNIKNALQKWLSLNEYLKAARAHHNLGMLYTKQKNYYAALVEFDSSISISNQHNYLSNGAIGYISKAYVYSLLKNIDLADAFSDKALELSCYINDPLTIAEVYKIKGMIQEELKNIELSIEMMENSFRINNDFDNQLNEAEANWELNRLYRKLEKPDIAEEKKSAAIGYYDLIKAQSYINDLLAAQSN